MTKVGFQLNSKQNPVSIPVQDSQKPTKGNHRFKKHSSHEKDNRANSSYFTPPFYTPECTNKETLHLINKLDRKSRDYIYHIMYLGHVAFGNEKITTEMGNEWVMPGETQPEQERQPEPVPETHKPISYQKQLTNDGYRIAKIAEKGNNFYAAVTTGLRYMDLTHPRYPKNIDELKNMIQDTLNTQPEVYTGSILALIMGDIWEMVKQTDVEELDKQLAQLPQGFGYPLSNFHYHFWHSEEDEGEQIENDVGRWAEEEGVKLYIDAMKEGFVFEGTLECGIISQQIDLPFTIHKIGRRGIGTPILIGDVETPPEKRLHLYHYANRFDLMLHPKQIQR